MSLQGKIFITEKRGKIPASSKSLIDFKNLITYTQDLKAAALGDAGGAATAEVHVVRGVSAALRRRPEQVRSR